MKKQLRSSFSTQGRRMAVADATAAVMAVATTAVAKVDTVIN
jgi:hypothetical protein